MDQPSYSSIIVNKKKIDDIHKGEADSNFYLDFHMFKVIYKNVNVKFHIL